MKRFYHEASMADPELQQFEILAVAFSKDDTPGVQCVCNFNGFDDDSFGMALVMYFLDAIEDYANKVRATTLEAAAERGELSIVKDHLRTFHKEYGMNLREFDDVASDFQDNA